MPADTATAAEAGMRYRALMVPPPRQVRHRSHAGSPLGPVRRSAPRLSLAGPLKHRPGPGRPPGTAVGRAGNSTAAAPRRTRRTFLPAPPGVPAIPQGAGRTVTRQTEAVPGRTARYQNARHDPSLVVLEGFHALKHALRFGAQVIEAATSDPAAVLALAESLAPDLVPTLPALLAEVSPEEFAGLAPSVPPTLVVALAHRPEVTPSAVLAAPEPDPVVLLDRPNHLGNLGAVVRVAAAAGAAGVITTGERDPWHPVAVRGSAGLHFAVAVARLTGPLPDGRPLVAVDPQGAPLWQAALPARALLAFGGERHGLGPDLLDAASLRVAIPMEPGVSSLNLATAAAVVLFEARRLRSG